MFIDLAKLEPNTPTEAWLQIQKGRGQLRVQTLLEGDAKALRKKQKEIESEKHLEDRPTNMMAEHDNDAEPEPNAQYADEDDDENVDAKFDANIDDEDDDEDEDEMWNARIGQEQNEANVAQLSEETVSFEDERWKHPGEEAARELEPEEEEEPKSAARAAPSRARRASHLTNYDETVVRQVAGERTQKQKKERRREQQSATPNILEQISAVQRLRENMKPPPTKQNDDRSQ